MITTMQVMPVANATIFGGIASLSRFASHAVNAASTPTVPRRHGEPVQRAPNAAATAKEMDAKRRAESAGSRISSLLTLLAA